MQQRFVRGCDMTGGLAECRLILQRYPAVEHEPVERPRLQPCATGFSGAGVWRVDVAGASWCLRRWPKPGLPDARLRELHCWLQYLHVDGALPLAVPLRSRNGHTSVYDCGATWQLETWLPGEADRAALSDARLTNAMQALARLHVCSARYQAHPAGAEWFAARRGRSPSVAARLRLLSGWSSVRFADALRQLSECEPLRLQSTAARVVRAARVIADDVRRQLAAVADVVVPLLPCLRDVWREHILFTGEDVTGIIDPSAARTETVATDLSRWLGSVLGREPHRRPQALAAYQAIRPLSDGELRLLPVLDVSNVLLSGLHWAERLVPGTISDPGGRLADRLSALAERLESLVGRPQESAT